MVETADCVSLKLQTVVRYCAVVSLHFRTLTPEAFSRPFECVSLNAGPDVFLPESAGGVAATRVRQVVDGVESQSSDAAGNVWPDGSCCDVVVQRGVLLDCES